MMILQESFEVHDELNPKLWDGFKLKDDIHDKILEIVEEFKKYCDIDLNIIDIQLVGSNVNYTYTDKSDLDIHIVINFEDIDASEDITKKLVDSYKSDFNKAYSITLHGIDAEVYVEDVKANTVSNGIYSVINNEWIKKPQKPTDIKEVDVSDLVEKWKLVIGRLLESNDIALIQSTIDNLYLIRKNSLAIDGEYGAGNQLFKELRNYSLIQQLKDKIVELKSSELTVENINK